MVIMKKKPAEDKEQSTLGDKEKNTITMREFLLKFLCKSENKEKSN